MAENTDLDKGLLWLIVGFSKSDSPFQDRVTEHVYRAQQGEDYGAPYAELTVPPTYWADVKDQVREEREEGEATMAVALDVFQPYFKDNLNIHA